MDVQAGFGNLRLLWNAVHVRRRVELVNHRQQPFFRQQIGHLVQRALDVGSLTGPLLVAHCPGVV